MISEMDEGDKKEVVVLSWVAPSRPFKRRSRDFYVTIVSIAVLLGIILFFIEGIIPVFILFSLVFLFYVMSTVEPENIEYKITNKGIDVLGKKVNWDEARRFWFVNRFGSEILVVEINKFPGRLEMLFPSSEKQKIAEEFKKHIQEETISPSFVDKSIDRISRVFPE